MPTIQDLRTDFPDLQGLDDDQLIGAVQQALYPDLPRERVAAHFGVQPRPAAAPTAAPPAPSGVMRRAADVALSVGKGVIGVPEALVGMANLATGGRAGQMVEQAGVRFKDAKAVLDDYMSPEAKAAQQKFQQSTGVMDAIGTAVTNPSLIVNAAAESLPMMGMGGAIARPLMAAAPRLGAMGAAAAGEGIGAAGSSAEQIRQQTADGLLTNVQSGVAAVSGAATGLLGVLGGKIAQRLGIADVDTLIAGGAGPAVTKGFVRRVLEGAASEGLLEELPQSIQEQVAQNFALGKPLDEGVAQAAVLGALTGGAMGGAVNVFAGRPPAGPLQRAVETVVPPVAPDGAPSAPSAPGAVPPDGGAPGAQAAVSTMLDEERRRVELEARGNELLQQQIDAARGPAPDADGVIPDPTAPVQPPLIDPVAQREADRPAEPTEQAQPDDVLNKRGKPFLAMVGALRAMKGRDATHDIVRVVGGLVLRPKPGSTEPNAAAPAESQGGSIQSVAPETKQPEAAAPSTPAAPAPAPELDMGQPAKPRTVTVNEQTVALSPEQSAEWDRVGADYKEKFDQATATFERTRQAPRDPNADPDIGARTAKEQLEVTRKRLGMELSAERRRIAGVQTPKEQAAAAQQAARVRAGDTVQTPQGTGTVVANVFGKVKVQIGDQTVMVPRGDVTKTTQEVPRAPVQPTRTDATTQGPATPTAEAPAPAGSAAAPAAGVPGAGAAPAALETPGVAGPAIDSEWTAFAPETGTRGVPRAEMPQVKAEHRGAMVNFLAARGITHESDAEVDPATLKPTQAEFSPGKVAKAREFTGGDRSILVSSDGHVLDGHHQWMKHLEDGTPVKVIRLDAPIDELLPVVKEFPSAEAAAGATQGATVAPDDAELQAARAAWAESHTEANRERLQRALGKAPADEPIVEHVTGKGKTLRGVVRNIPEAEARAMDSGTFKKNGGWFIRASRAGLSAERLREIADAPPGDAPAAPAPSSAPAKPEAASPAEDDQPAHIKSIHGWWGVNGSAGQPDALTPAGRIAALQKVGVSNQRAGYGKPGDLTKVYWTYLPEDLRTKLAALRRDGWIPEEATQSAPAPAAPAPRAPEAPSASAAPAPPPTAPRARPEALIAARKRLSVLESLRRCLG